MKYNIRLRQVKMPACNLRFGAMATRFRRNFKEIKNITLESVATNRNAATSPSRRGVTCKRGQRYSKQLRH